MTGRSLEYTENVASEILQRFSEGATLTEIANMEQMPHLATIYRWKARVPAFGEALDRAREQHIEATVDQIQLIADTEMDPQRARNRIEARKWRAAKLRPDRYGDSVRVDVTGQISVRAAMEEALARLPRPSCDLSPVIDVECEEIRALPDRDPADRRSAASTEAPAPSSPAPSIFD